jgi:hypothetical protein
MRPRFYDILLEWLEANLPEVRRRFELHMLPLLPGDRSRYALHVPWLQDPVQQWSGSTFRHAARVSEDLARSGVATINPVTRLTNATKSTGANLMSAAGVRTPRTVRIDDAEEFRDTLLGLEAPLIVREDWGHSDDDDVACGRVVRCEDGAQARALDLARFARPVAMEYVETRSAGDGLYRKYRYVVAGELGVPLHMQAKDHWFVKGLHQAFSPDLAAEDLAYLSRPDPNHELLQRARRALDLDFLAFDYSYDGSGGLVVWEANPFPLIHFSLRGRRYRTPAVERTLAAMVHLYHTRAGLPVPDAVLERVSRA